MGQLLILIVFPAAVSHAKTAEDSPYGWIWELQKRGQKEATMDTRNQKFNEIVVNSTLVLYCRIYQDFLDKSNTVTLRFIPTCSPSRIESRVPSSMIYSLVVYLYQFGSIPVVHEVTSKLQKLTEAKAASKKQNKTIISWVLLALHHPSRHEPYLFFVSR